MVDKRKRWASWGLVGVLGIAIGTGIVGHLAGADTAAAVVGAVLAVTGAVLILTGQLLISPEQKEGSNSTVPTQAELKGGRNFDVETWADSAERIAHFARRRLIYMTASGGALMALGGIVLLESYRSQSLFLTGGTQGGRYAHLSGTLIVIVGGLVLLFSAIPYLSARAAFRSRKAATADALVDKAIREVTTASTGKDMLPLPGLFELNRRQLDAYQQTTRRQQQLAFLLAQTASVVAFLVLIAGIVLAFAAHNTVEKYICGGLSGLGTVLSVFLARTFFASQKDANDQMNRYYLEPQRTGRLLAAERALDKIQNVKDAALLAEIVKALLAWEMPVGSADTKTRSARVKASDPTPTSPMPTSPTPTSAMPTSPMPTSPMPKTAALMGQLANRIGGDKSASAMEDSVGRSARLAFVTAIGRLQHGRHNSGRHETHSLS